ncbi:probable prolyl 4-hydroxylase 7 [Ananas comosus]|uniref:Probable prolyl 4-hydroxylase 7 n=1 Tax=Ananas comosus TaxID=4615 RepID=A0A6P5GXB4_ANACO|nr:probable prolyl 4-hydroxylase 7 [Ananas comosus]
MDGHDDESSARFEDDGKAEFVRAVVTTMQEGDAEGTTHGKLKRSRIVANATGLTIPSNKRTSSGMFLRPGQDEIVQRIEQRIAAWTYLPEENGERIQILRYKKGEKFDVHNDYFSFAVNLRQGNRIATVLMYLSDVEKGGETFFPKVGPLQKKDDSWSFCASTVLAVKPKKGDALLFFNLKPNGGIDEFSRHGSCPVIEGVKWTATRWIHVIPYNNNITLGSNNHYVY